jgi:hypothetical protein
VDEAERILKLLGCNSPIKSGKLKFFNLSCEDLEQNPISKALRVINTFITTFRIDYFPPLKGDILFLNEDKSSGKMELIYRARKKGIKTVVVQHGMPCGSIGFIPLLADYFMCWEESYERFLGWGIEKEQLIVFKAEAPNDLKLIKGVEAVFFLVDPNKGHEPELNGIKIYGREEILEHVKRIVALDPDVVIKPHMHLFEAFEGALDVYRVVWDRAEDLIFSAKRIYAFKDCTTVKDAEVQGKRAVIVDG